jgi:phage major head subunit gpT-like protein
LLHPERFSDFNDQTGQFHFPGWRCLACGEVLDPVILANRRHPKGVSALSKK